MKLQCGDKLVDLSTPHIMGVLNVTPDSFYDGGTLYKGGELSLAGVLARAEKMLEEGATFIDIGGESTRPGAQPVGLEEEKHRVLPVIEYLAKTTHAVISVDSSQPEIMLAAADLGAGFLNDVRALRLKGAQQAAAQTGLPVCLMHMQGEPATMQHQPDYKDVVKEVSDFFIDSLARCEASGISSSRCVIDPGIGFGKRDEHNLALINQLDTFSRFGCPVLFGVSRKSMIGRLLDRDVDARLAGSLAFALIALQKGANILRVHDVAGTRDVIKVYQLTDKNYVSTNSVDSCDNSV